MPQPKRVVVERASASRIAAPPKGVFAATYETLTSAENASMVRSIAAFGVAVAFLWSPFSEFLVPA